MNSGDQQQVQYFPVVLRSRQELIAHEPSGGGALRQGAAAAAFFGAFLGCLITLHLAAGGFLPAIASALATVLLCGLVLATRTTNFFPEEVFAAIYGGSFAGMTPVLRLIDNMRDGPAMSANAMFILLSIVCGLAFWVVAKIDTRSGRRLAGSCGGRSGATAAAASFLFVELAPLFGAHGAIVPATGMSDVAPMSAALTCAACMIGMFATLIVLRRPSVGSAEPADRIFVAAVVALTGLCALRLTTPIEASVLDAFYAGCFLGMSAPRRLQGWIQPCFAAILLTAILVPVRALLPGIGGSLGLAALVTLTVLAGLRQITVPTNGSRSPEKQIKAAAGASADGRTGAGAHRWVLSGRAIAVAGSVMALLAIEYFAGSARVGPERSTLLATASARLAEHPTPIPLQPALAEATPATASAGALNGDPGAAAKLSPDTDVAVIHSAPSDGAAANGPAEPEHVDRTEGVSTADPADGKATANIKAGEVPVDDVPESRQGLLREFLQWQTAHPDSIPHPVPLPVKRSRNRASPLVRLTPTGSAMQSQPVQKRLPNRPTLASATEAAVSGARTNQPGSVRNSGIRSAPGQTVPR